RKRSRLDIHIRGADNFAVERLNLLAVALGLAALAGVNLYLTVFATGLAIHFHWITLAPDYQSLDVLGNPWVITIAGVLYFLEFLADKIPWVDSIWDAVHTVIRPIGGALLAIQVLGHTSPTFTVMVALLGGGTSLVSHTAKTATRLASNTSPEPFSNIALSFGVDVFSAQQVGQTTAWAVPCLSGRGRGIPANLFGALVAMNEEPRKLLFIARKNGRPFAQSIDLEGMKAAREPKFLSENLNIVPG